MAKTNQEAEALQAIAKLIGMGAEEVYKIYLRKTIVEGLSIFLLGGTLLGIVFAAALGVTLPLICWILIALGMGIIIFSLRYFLNASYYAVAGILDELGERKWAKETV